MKWDIFFRTVLITGMAMVVEGCASVERSVALGAGIGGATGGLVGLAARDRPDDATSIVIGTLVGAATGGLFGYLGFQENEKKARIASMRNPELEERVPYLKDAKIQRMWVPGKIEGNRFIWGHWVDIIERPASWGVNHDER